MPPHLPQTLEGTTDNRGGGAQEARQRRTGDCRVSQTGPRCLRDPGVVVDARRWVPTDRSRHLTGRASKDTAPEILLRRALHAAGARFRLQRRLAPGCTADLVLPGRRLAVFVDGCFWHSCPDHGRSDWTGPNADLWKAKMRRNTERDRRSSETARRLGWTVVRIWEHEITADPPAAAQRILAASTVTAGSWGCAT